MEQSPRRHFSNFLVPRAASNRTSRSTTSTSDESSSLSQYEEEAGRLGLTTVYEPDFSTPTVDIVFIHGLGGNSTKTWSNSGDPKSFWPKAWLPFDPDFVNTRIHVFGYMASWKVRQENPLNIHFIAQTLLGELKNHPGIRKDATKLIFVGHSMGGCVAKKAYVLARQDPTCHPLAERVHSMFFLGTPHRGSDLAPVLDGMATLAFGKKQFVRDLMPNSSALTDMNDTFRHYALDLRLWSFYETKPVVTSLVNRIIVEKSSSTLDYPNEEIAAMNADHRHVCRFESRDDPNYRLLRNALHTALDQIKEGITDAKQEPEQTEQAPKSQTHAMSVEDGSRLLSFLNITDQPEDDLTVLQLLKEAGSCEWLAQKPCFTEWEQRSGPQVLWLTGRPAAGKSVLAGHVVDRLESSPVHCSSFFFKHEKSGKTTLSDCFMSLAYQMARKDEVVRESILNLIDEQSTWDKTDGAGIWRKLFVGTVFKCPTIGQHVWVVDGIDECSHFNTLFTKKLLVGIPDKLRLFATSRDLEEVGRGLTSMGSRVTIHPLSEDDTFDDMRLFLSAKLTELDRLENSEDREAMCDKILQKSRGSFLWVRLVLQDFENAWTDEAMEAVLEEIPTGLHEVYERILLSIEADSHKRDLAKSILTWVTLAATPLTIDELRCAIKLDINQTMQNMVKAIPNLCGQLVFVDQSQKVQVIHETARQFLLRNDLESQLSIQKNHSNTRLSFLLIQYLSKDVLKPHQPKPTLPGRPKGLGASRAATFTTPDVALVNYAARFFPDHVYRSSSEDDALIEEMCDFFKSPNILYWIEHHAERKDLGTITNAAMNLRGYLERRTKYVAPTDPQVHLIDSWVVDLIRVTAKFRSQLLSCPSSIHCLIPPLCPPQSIISRAFSKESRLSPLVVKNLPGGSWDDCLTRIDFTQGLLSFITHGESLFAVGFSTGRIALYDPNSLQYLREIKHAERVVALKFSPEGDTLVCCGTKSITAWDTRTGAGIGSSTLPSLPLDLTFLESDQILVFTQSNGLIRWNFESGESDTLSWLDNEVYVFPSQDEPFQHPSRAAFLTADNGEDMLLAVAYRSHPVCIWNPIDMQMLGQCGTAGVNGITAMTFNPNPEIPALVVSYAHGDLCLYDYSTMDLENSIPKAYADCVSCSMDGRTLVTGSSHGIIQVFEFDMGHNDNMILAPIYRVKAATDAVRGVAFSFDGLRFVDIVRRQCRVWEPAALVRKDNELESTSEAFPLSQPAASIVEAPQTTLITSRPAASQDGRFVLAGRKNGSVVIFSAQDGSEVCEAYSHGPGASVTTVLLAGEDSMIISATDAAGVVVVEMPNAFRKTSGKIPDQTQAATPGKTVLSRRFGAAVTDLKANLEANRLLVSGHDVDELWELPSGRTIETRRLQTRRQSEGLGINDTEREAASYRSVAKSVLQHPTNASLFIIIIGDRAHVFRWEDFVAQTPEEGILLQRPEQYQYSSGSVTTYHPGTSNTILEHTSPTQSQPGRVITWPAAAFDPSSSLAGLPARDGALDTISPAVLCILGILNDSKLLFIDLNLWVCSADLRNHSSTLGAGDSRRVSLARSPSPLRPGSLSSRQSNTGNATRRHFFALSEWQDRQKRLSCAVLPQTSRGGLGSSARTRSSANFAFVSGHRLIIVEGGLEFSETVEVPSKAGTRAGAVPRYSSTAGRVSPVPNATSTGQQWTVVSGSMHRRASNW